MFFEDQQHNECLPDLLVTTVQRTCHQCLFVHPLLELFQDARDRQGSHFGDKVKIVIHVDLSQLIPALFCHALDIIAVKIIHQLELPSLQIIEQPYNLWKGKPGLAILKNDILDIIIFLRLIYDIFGGLDVLEIVFK